MGGKAGIPIEGAGAFLAPKAAGAKAWLGATIARGMAALAAAGLAGCAMTMPYSGEFEELRGKTVLIYFPASESELDAICDEVSGSPLPVHGCAVIADRLETAQAMGTAFRAIGEREGASIECVLIVPTGAGVVQHELGLCATQAEGYWNAHRNEDRTLRSENETGAGAPARL